MMVVDKLVLLCATLVLMALMIGFGRVECCVWFCNLEFCCRDLVGSGSIQDVVFFLQVADVTSYFVARLTLYLLCAMCVGVGEPSSRLRLLRLRA